MITVTLDASEVLNTLDGMTEKLATFPRAMAEQLTAWQTDDMHRKYPNTTIEDKDVYTLIWPTSRMGKTNEKTSERRRGAFLRRARRPVVRQPSGTAKPASTRPILRDELFEQLAKRMDELMGDELTWKD